jgi:hypothetical protein
MGAFISILSSITQIIFCNISGLPLEEAPITYTRAEDYSCSGVLVTLTMTGLSKYLKKIPILSILLQHRHNVKLTSNDSLN